jgi:hypothetical protein
MAGWPLAMSIIDLHRSVAGRRPANAQRRELIKTIGSGAAASPIISDAAALAQGRAYRDA